MDVSTHYVYIRNESLLSFKDMQNRDDLSDIQLCCSFDKRRFKVHRFLLAACSPYFQSLFQQNSCENLNILLDNVDGADLKHVLTYMYEGSVRLKNDDLQGFGELLEMFLMPLPADMIVSCDDSDNDPESIRQIDGMRRLISHTHTHTNYSHAIANKTVIKFRSLLWINWSTDNGIDEFVANVSDVFDKLTPGNLTEQSTILFGLADGSTFRFEAIVNMLIQNVLKITPWCISRLLSSLVKIICNQDQSKQFQEHIRHKSVHVLRYLLNTATQQRIPSQWDRDDNGNSDGPIINSLDREVIRIEHISYHWDVMRRRRFTHFIGELFAANIISYTDIFELKQSNPELAADFILKNKFNPMNCCDFDMPKMAKDIIHNESYRYAREVEKHLFCLRIEVFIENWFSFATTRKIWFVFFFSFILE